MHFILLNSRRNPEEPDIQISVRVNLQFSSEFLLTLLIFNDAANIETQLEKTATI